MSRSSEGADCSHEEASAAPDRGSSTQTARIGLTIGIDLGDVSNQLEHLARQRSLPGRVVERARIVL